MHILVGFYAAFLIANVSDADDILLKTSNDGTYNVKVALVQGGSQFGPVIMKVHFASRFLFLSSRDLHVGM